MKLLQEADDATNNRKLVKSQVEKRRRERMNRSLEHLRTMLLQEPQQGGTKHRVEKAEILEHTVLFLQKTAKEHQEKAGGQNRPFQDGFSTCLQRASQFLGPEGKGLWLGPALDATFAARFARSDTNSSGATSRTSSSLPHTKSILHMLRQKSKYRLHTRAFGVSSFQQPHLFPVQQSFPRAPQQPQRQSRLEMRAERSATKESSSQSCPLSQTLWRPWP
ncbi:hairy and enhancer of split related-7 [Melanotaenia boesemani]|uniref:hairy and enhancer of split related-7 n=1 Tax=Melanotaenia boesemani TaxID=1250792 RepID=UPI001C0495F9|nr:hairy and enhancer of split related-7 [Melanotaenia boesemani]